MLSNAKHDCVDLIEQNLIQTLILFVKIFWFCLDPTVKFECNFISYYFTPPLGGGLAKLHKAKRIISAVAAADSVAVSVTDGYLW